MQAIFFILINLFLIAPSRPTCKCTPISVEDNFNNSTSVFSGKVIKVDTIRYIMKGIAKGHFYECQLISIAKNESFKSGITKDTVMIVTGIGSGDCGYQFKSGENYLVYTSLREYNLIDPIKCDGSILIGNTKLLETTNCDRTTDSVNVESARIRFLIMNSKKNGT